jgi:hypothetical protein
MIKKWYKYYVLKESIKDIELNSILDKISSGKELTIRENNFLNLYNQILDNDCKDYSYLSRELACNKIEEYLDKKKKIYCDICDKNGKISEKIVSLDRKEFKLNLRHSIYIMEDRFLYNISYNIKKDEYSLTCQDEYYEEISVWKE